MFVAIETRDQSCQRGLPAAGTANQRDHLAGFDRHIDVVEDLPFSIVAEREIPDFDPSRNTFAFHRAVIDFGRFVKLGENTLGTRQPLLDRRADFRQLTDRLG